ncbi:MAG: DoxX family protein [Solirubrobacteraceae bacterium]
MKRLHLLTDRPPLVADAGLLALRLAVGAIFIVHGAGDVFDAGVSTNIENYRDAGIPLAELSAPFTAYVQLIGGIAVVFGAFTRPFSIGFMVAMAGALIYVHRGEPLAIQPDGSGFGFALMMGAASVALLLLGPGRLSVDRLLARGRARPEHAIDSAPRTVSGSPAR